MKKLSVVVCVYNEEKNIQILSREIIQALKGIDFETIFVDDGSTDRTRHEICRINDERFILVELYRNYGQSSALQAGIDASCGEFIALLDGDLQNDPADIPGMLEMAQNEEWDMVAGVRSNRKDGIFARKIPSRIANLLIRKTTGIQMKDMGCTLKLFSSEAVKNIRIYGELHRFIPVLLSLEGATRITQVDVSHRPRQFGKSNYNLSRTTRVMSDLLLMLFFKKFFQRPMHFFGQIGFLIFLIGMIINFYLFVLKIMGQDIWGKPLLLLGILLVLGGLQFITTGIIVDIQTRTYYESQNKTPYRIRRIKNTGNSKESGRPRE